MLLTDRYAHLDIHSILISKAEYKPIPSAADRGPWSGLPRELLDAIIAKGVRYKGFDWPMLPATLFMEYKRNGNLSRSEDKYSVRRYALAALVAAECAEYSGRFLDDIINGVWCICEETTWCTSHSDFLPDVSCLDIDLNCAHTAAFLSWIYYLLKPELDAQCKAVCRRIAYEVGRRVLDPYLAQDDFWWMGFIKDPDMPVNNWNPWCNSNCLMAFLLVEDDEARRAAATSKCLASLDNFLENYPGDGGCDEGPVYWTVAGGSLFDCLELLHGATNGAIDVYDDELIGNIGRFICRTHISGKYYINHSDGDAVVNISAEMIWRYGCRIKDGSLSALGLAQVSLEGCLSTFTDAGESMFRYLCYIMNFEKIRGIAAKPPFLRDVWLEGIQVMAAREHGGTDKGLYLAAKGGHNNESHNHNDVGSFIVYHDGKPVIIDIGVEVYSAKTFSSDRYSIWTMQSSYHNLPCVNGVQQIGDNKSYHASDVFYENSEDAVLFGMNLATAYPENTGISKWRRTFTFNRRGRAFIEISEDFALRECSEDIALHFMTPCLPDLKHAGEVRLVHKGGQVLRLLYDSSLFSVQYERIDFDDRRLALAWGFCLYRIILSVRTFTNGGLWKFTICTEDGTVPGKTS